MTNRILAVVTSMLCAATFAFPQGDGGYEPIPPAKASAGKLGGGGGYTPGWLFMDVDALNQEIVAAGGAPFDDGRIFLQGGQGYAYILLVENLRVGGMGMSGSRSTSRLEVSTNVRRDVDLNVGYGGVTVEYTLAVVPRLDVTIGTLLGGGGMSLTLRRDEGSAMTWDDTWGDIGGTGAVTEFTRKMDGSFFIYQPSVTVEVALLRWLGIRAGVGYLGMAGGSWELDGHYDLLGVPDGIDASGWMINAGIYVGTFIY